MWRYFLFQAGEVSIHSPGLGFIPTIILVIYAILIIAAVVAVVITIRTLIRMADAQDRNAEILNRILHHMRNQEPVGRKPDS